MKEPITGRDLFIISTLCTGFGVLLAWGLFYRWGSLPPSRPIDWSAWAQAIGSLIAVAVAIYVPNRIAKNEHRRLARENYFHARSLAFVLRPSVQSLIYRVDSSRRRWSFCPEKFDDTEVAAPLEIPETLSKHLLDLRVLGTAGIAIQHAIIAVQELRTGIFTEYSNLVQGGVYIDPDDGEEIPLPDMDIPKLLKEAEAELKQALIALDGLL